jgi:hypothetical protein
MGGLIERVTIEVTGADGGAGVATASADSSVLVEGTIRAIHLTYVGSPPAGTTDVVIAEANNDPAVAILTVTDAATDGWFYPMAQAENQAGADITNQGTPIVVNDYISVTIAQANDDDGVTAVIVYER